MKPLAVIVIIVFTMILFLGCAELKIKNTISDFEDAINDNNYSNFEETLSTESDYRVSDPDGSGFLLNYFLNSSYDPVDYRNLDISIDGRDADVYSDGTYENGNTYTNVRFWMRREEGFFSFLSPDWRVYRYYDDIVDFNIPIWRKPQN